MDELSIELDVLKKISVYQPLKGLKSSEMLTSVVNIGPYKWILVRMQDQCFSKSNRCIENNRNLKNSILQQSSDFLLATLRLRPKRVAIEAGMLTFIRHAHPSFEHIQILTHLL